MSRSVVFVCLLAIAVAALYGPFLWNPIVFDDLPFFLVEDGGHQPVDDYRYSPFELRSLPYATLAWGKAWFGMEMLHFRIENALLHTAVVVVLFYFLRYLFRRLPVPLTFSPEAWAFGAALLFALHPVAVYAAGYLVQRTIVMATLFSLLAMLAWVHGQENTQPSWRWMAVLLYYFAVFSKEHAILLPGVLGTLTILLHPDDWKARMREARWQWLALAVIAAWVVAAKKGVLGTAYEIYAPDMLKEVQGSLSYPLSVLTQSGLFFKYAMLWLFPNPHWMSVDMREPFAQSLWSGYLLAFVGFLAWGGVAVWWLLGHGRWRMAGFALLFPWLMFLTEFSTIRIQESFVLYRSYLWAVGAFALLPLLLQPLSRQMASILIAAMAVALVPMAMDRLASFSHPLILWNDAAKLVEDRQELPGVFRIYYNRGTEFIKQGDYDSAIADLSRAIALYPEWPFSYNNLGVALLRKGRWQEAVVAFTAGIGIADRKAMGVNPKSYYGRATAYEKLGEYALARKDYELTCRVAGKGCDKLGTGNL